MVAIRHILFPTDFSESAEVALERAVAIASRYRAKLTILHVIVPHAEDTSDAESRFPDDDAIGALVPEGSDAPDVERITSRGYSAADKVLSFAESNDVDLVVMGSHGRRGFSRALLGSEAERVLRLAKCPVLTVSSKMTQGLRRTPTRILLPLDFSAASDRALAAGLSLATQFGAAVDVAHVFDEPVVPPFLMDHTGSYISTDPKMKDRCLASLEETLARHSFEGEITKHVLEGRVAPTVAELAEKLDADLVVIGTRGLSGLDFVLLGSTASHLLRLSPCPVLTMHESTEESRA